ncbi:hypothetical protein L1049_019132 [Liquidambar formosana]|uniref:Copper transport protein n=1 Tax=Liquidambar formosana TaxID=63359 RepID=A0AAP0RD07_LIQFO
MMHMTFYWSTGVTLLFDSWKTESWTSYSLTLLACFLVSALYQYMEDRRVRFKLIAAGAARTSSSSPIEAVSPPIQALRSRRPLVSAEVRRGRAVRNQLRDRVPPDACGDVLQWRRVFGRGWRACGWVFVV